MSSVKSTGRPKSVKHTCEEQGCNRKGTAGTYYLCNSHFKRHKHLGLIADLKKPCITVDCKFFVVYESRGLCTNCMARSVRKNDPDYNKKEQAYRQQRRDNEEGFREKCRIRRKQWCHEKSYYQTTEYKARKKEYYTSDHGRKLYAARAAKRRAIKLHATPPWAEIEQIKKMFQECPKGFQVDHIIPLNHPDVCGLHVLANLQLLPAKENWGKLNNFDGTYDNEGWRKELNYENRQEETRFAEQGAEATPAGYNPGKETSSQT